MNRKNSYLPDDLNAYDSGVKKGVDLALQSERLNINKQNSFNPFFAPKSYASFAQGLKFGYKIGISQREYQRLRELAKIGKIKGRDLER